MERFKEDIRTHHVKDNIVALPEQFYNSNLLELTHEATGNSLRFSAAGALRAWYRAGDTKDDNTDEDPATAAADLVHVPAAADWMRSRRYEMEAHNAKRINYDWTFTTDYRGTLVRHAFPKNTAAEPRADPQVATTCHLPAFVPTTDTMDRGMLTSRDPILFFDDLPLYESELEDHGVSQLSVKIRVMPKCWYVLLRFFLRVDGVLVRLRETRLFCRFRSPKHESEAVVLEEVRHHEGTFEDLVAEGAPAEGAAYADADAAALALQAAAPVGVTQYSMKKLEFGQPFMSSSSSRS